MRKIIIPIILSFIFTGELEVDGDLKVSGNIDANGNAITNVGEPVLTSDVATANYVLERTTGKGRIITLKCPWVNRNGNGSVGWEITTCEPPTCPNGWSELATFNEIVTMTTQENTGGYGDAWGTAGNTIRYCIEQEDEE